MIYDFVKYFDNAIQDLYIAEMLDKHSFKFENGSVMQFMFEIINKL